MQTKKAPGYRPTRILLAIAIIATGLAVVLALSMAFWAPSTMGGDNPSLFGLPSTVAFPLLGAGLAILNLVWSIHRSPSKYASSSRLTSSVLFVRTPTPFSYM